MPKPLIRSLALIISYGLFFCLTCCQPTQPAASTVPIVITCAQVQRVADFAGHDCNDQTTVTTAAGLAQLTSFFPDANVSATSPRHAHWTPGIIIRLTFSDGASTILSSDYVHYRDDSRHSGDFDISSQFPTYIDHLFSDPSFADRSWVPPPYSPDAAKSLTPE